MDPGTADSPFPVTRWSLILHLQGGADDRHASDALEHLCRDYWYPLYAFARRHGQSPHDAQDATQGFFAYLLEHNLFSAAAPQLGKLRTFLLTAFERFLHRALQRDQAQKRGAGAVTFSLSVEVGEARYIQEPASLATPERLFDRSWAYALLERTTRALAEREAAAGRLAQFQALEPFINPGASQEPAYADAAARLGSSEEAVRQAVSRLRVKFRNTLRREIADTLQNAAESVVDEELTALRTALMECGGRV